MNETALIIVDVQNDFCDNGSLPVPNAEQIIPGINKIIEYFHSSFLPVYATRDWHPIDHCSFKSNGGFAFTTSVKLPSKSVTAPVVASNTTFAPGTGTLSSAITVPVTVVCA